jgi:ribose-phosphate pyrophosphokinase
VIEQPTKPLAVIYPGNESLGRGLATALDAEVASLTLRQFPDEESYVHLAAACEARDVIVIASFDRPNPKLLPLLFLADLAHELGARRVILVAPYLAYMRQDTRFKPGEAVTSRSFAKLISGSVDALVTIDPHLHRYATLAELYPIPTRVIHASALLAEWIRAQIEQPLLVGPDSESAQWVAEVARLAAAPYVVLEKTRRGDRDVEVSVPDLGRWRDRQPVLIDDIISTAHTMIETVKHLTAAGLPRPICVAVHAVFAGDAHRALQAAGAERIVTTNTIAHETNEIDVSGALAAAIGST